MAAYIQNIATVTPEQFYEQDFIREQMKKYFKGREATKRIIHRIYAKSGIEKRHTVLHDFNENGSSPFFFKKNGTFNSRSTSERNKIYEEKAKALFVKTARKTINKNPSMNKNDITDVITVSCTGFFAPGPAFEIIRELDLHPSTQRYHLGFMGCFAAFPAMRMAKSICESQKNACVLVVCLELCTIHLQSSVDIDNLVSASVFADGAAGMIIHSQKSTAGASYKLNHFATSVAENSEEDMAWTIGDTGFNMKLSRYVPEIIDQNISPAIQSLFNDYHLSPELINHWAMHPGGRAILDKIQTSLDLPKDGLASSRNILANYGNMSSATILFVLADLLSNAKKNDSEQVLAMAFGPGLTIESGLLIKE